MMDIPWGAPVALIGANGDTVARVDTIETARHCLRRRWPTTDASRHKALAEVEAAMECMTSVDDARLAFLEAARVAGFVPTPLR